ncbi:SapC family protein [Parvularcula oceani]|uniref:SapC family protein n=1 Tax=Parvularcula oceani TaxID=1247963 RepID=UPI00192E4F98|nr:SapC family protein [Parvularcula oceani]
MGGCTISETVLLRDDLHHDLKVSAAHGAEFGDAVNVMRLFPTEFVEAQRHFPILFQRDAKEGWMAIALLGFARGENLFLDNGAWTSDYVPAIQRRGPFAIGLQRDEGGTAEPTLRIDMNDPRVGASDGYPLFLENGGNAPYLDYVSAALRTVHEGLALTGPMFAAFEEAGILEPVTLEIALSDETEYKAHDFHAIGTEHLNALGADALDRLHRKGFLALAFAGAMSLSNVNRLIERWRKRNPAA